MNSLKRELKDLKYLKKMLKKINFEIEEARGDSETFEEQNVQEFYKYNFTIVNQLKFYKSGIEASKKRIKYKIKSLNEDEKEVICLRALKDMKWTEISRVTGLRVLEIVFKYKKAISGYQDTEAWVKA